MSDTDRAPDFEIEEERRQLELDRIALEQTPQGRVLMHVANRLLAISERMADRARQDERRFEALERRVTALENALEGNGAVVE